MRFFSNNIIFIFLIFFSFYADSKTINLKKEIPKNKKLINQKPLKILWTEKKGSVPFKVEVLAEDLGVPWGMVFLNQKELLWTEKEGSIKKIHIPTGQITPITGGPKVYAKGQGGLLDVALHPEF